MLSFSLRLEPLATSRPAMAGLLEMITLCGFNYDLISMSVSKFGDQGGVASL